MKVRLILACFLIAALVITCRKADVKEDNEEIATAKTPAAKNCFTVCDVTKNQDLQIVTNAQEERPLLPDGIIDSFSYFFLKYHVRTQPIRLTQNYITPASYTIKYGWDSGVIVNRVQLQCLVENVSPFGCSNDWVFTESQGYLVGPNYFFDGLFEFETYEWVNDNHWKYLYTDFKKEFYPSVVPTQEYVYNNNFCYYNRAIQAQTGDFYGNPFRYPNHDGRYKTIIKFNPQVKGCRAVKETDYSNNEVTIDLEILNGVVFIKK